MKQFLGMLAFVFLLTQNTSSQEIFNSFEAFASESSFEGTWSKEFNVPGIVGTIYASASDGTNLYVGGNFKSAGSVIANSMFDQWEVIELLN